MHGLLSVVGFFFVYFILSSSVSQFLFFFLFWIAVHSFDKLRRDGCERGYESPLPPDVIALIRALFPVYVFMTGFFLIF